MEIGRPQDGQLELYKSLFRVREDVFAIRWEKPVRSSDGGNKKGYSPAYHFDPYLFKLHKMKGGTLGNFPDKTYLKLDNSQLIKHFLGQQHIGGYPLLEDNSSWFIAADFDGSKWKNESLKFLEECNKNDIPAYLERSQSGNGAHVWIFFDQNYPAMRSRKVIIQLLQKIDIFSVFDKTSSFDRLFPNQDFHSGKGLGNLIALPLHGKSLQKDNSCFIDPKTFEPFKNQWEFLTEVQKVKTSLLESIYKNQEQTKPETGANNMIGLD